LSHLHAGCVVELVEAVARPRHGVADADDAEHDAAERTDEPEEERESPQADAARRVERMPRLPASRGQRDTAGDQNGDEENESEDGAVVADGRLGRAGLREALLLHRPPRDRDRDRDRHEQREDALEPRPADDEPGADRDRADEDAAAGRSQRDRDEREHEHRRRPRSQDCRVHAAGGEPQPERQRHRHEQRERVPVPDWGPEAGTTRILGTERGDDLAREGPQHHEAERRRETSRDHARSSADRRSDHNSQHEQGEVHDATVEGAPRAVRLDRPDDRDRAPDRPRREQSDHPERGKVEVRTREDAERDRRRRGRRSERGGDADRCQPALAGAGAEEDRHDEQHTARREEEGLGARQPDSGWSRRRPTFERRPHGG
jgi:hypothetical protein